jgi:hypothetical protein
LISVILRKTGESFEIAVRLKTCLFLSQTKEARSFADHSTLLPGLLSFPSDFLSTSVFHSN